MLKSVNFESNRKLSTVSDKDRIKLQGENLFAFYNKKSEAILKNINFTFKQGEFVVLCGRSGCGKSTFLSVLNTLGKNFFNLQLEGRLSLFSKVNYETTKTELSTVEAFKIDEAGDNIKTSSSLPELIDLLQAKPQELVAEIGQVFQNPKTQYFNTTVCAELAFPCENLAWSPELIKKSMQKNIIKFSLENLLDKNIFYMSGGEKQRLAFAVANMAAADLLLLDEPTANLDTRAMKLLAEALAQVKKEGKTVIIAEHRLAWLQDLADTYLLLNKGEIYSRYTATEFLAQNADFFIRHGLRQGRKDLLAQLIANVCKTRSLNHRQVSDEHQGECTAAIYDRRSRNNSDKNFAAKTEKPACLCLRNLTVGYPRQKALLFIKELDFQSGIIYGISGHNACGKSTLAQILCGLKKHVKGSILYQETADMEGSNPISARHLRYLTYMVMQDVNYQLFHASVKEEILQGAEADEYYEFLLAKLQLKSKEFSHPFTLSGGEKQRVAIAAALMSRKKIIIFDEPSSGLDKANMTALGDLLRFLADQNKLVMVISHDEELLAEFSEVLITLDSELYKIK